jgi:nucleoid DNA-binding protein
MPIRPPSKLTRRQDLVRDAAIASGHSQDHCTLVLNEMLHMMTTGLILGHSITLKGWFHLHPRKRKGHSVGNPKWGKRAIMPDHVTVFAIFHDSIKRGVGVGK